MTGINQYKIFKFIAFIIFTRVIYYLIGIPDPIINLIIESLTFFIVFETIVIKNNNNFRFTNIVLFIIITIIIIVSYTFSAQVSFFETLSFYRHILFSFCFFLFALNFKFTKIQIINFINFIKFLIALQFLGGFGKLIFLGPHEKYAGLLSAMTGSLNAIFPLISIIFVLVLHFGYRKDKYIVFYCIGILFVGLIGVKRGFFAFLPLLLYFFFLLKPLLLNEQKLRLFSKTFISIPAIFVLLTMSIILNPYLNKEGVFFGSLDYTYAIDLVVEHNYNQNYLGYRMGRIGGTLGIIDYRLENLKPSDFWGDGPGLFVRESNESSNITFYGVKGFTVLPGFARHLIEVGFLGVIFILLFYLHLVLKAWKILKKSSQPLIRSFAVITILIGSIFVYDYILYSPVFYNDYFPNFIFFSIGGLMLNKNLSDIDW